MFRSAILWKDFWTNNILPAMDIFFEDLDSEQFDELMASQSRTKIKEDCCRPKRTTIKNIQSVPVNGTFEIFASPLP